MIGFREIVRVNFLASDGSAFSAEDLTGPAQTEVIDVRGLAWVTLYLDVASVSGTADVTVNANVGPSSDDVSYPIQSELIESGVATFNDYVPTKSVTTSKAFPVTFNVLNHSYLQVSITATSGTVDLSITGGI